MFGLGRYAIGWWGNGGGGGGGGIQTIVPGRLITVDATDPENPIVATTAAAPPIETANYSALPDPTTVPGQTYIVLASQGTRWLPGTLGGTYYPRGYYYSDGTAVWVYSDVPYNASQATVNTGTNDDEFLTPLTFTNSTKLVAALRGVFGITVTGVGGAVVSTGSKGYVTIPNGFTIVSFYVEGNASGSIQFDLKDSGGTSIIGAGNKPLLSSAQFNNAAVSGWTTTAFAANTRLEWVVDSATTISTCNVQIFITKTS